MAQTRPEVDLTPTLEHLRTIVTDTSTPLDKLREKAAFLLAMAAFLRPSDLHRIDKRQCSLLPENQLQLYIAAPKETRHGRAIIKTPVVFPNAIVPVLCPVAAFAALRDHPVTTSGHASSLFVNATDQQMPLEVTTISTCLRRLMRMSTSIRPTPSVRSVASDLALSRGTPLEDVVTVGNRSSPAVFDTHYRRKRQLRTNVTHALLR